MGFYEKSKKTSSMKNLSSLARTYSERALQQDVDEFYDGKQKFKKKSRSRR